MIFSSRWFVVPCALFLVAAQACDSDDGSGGSDSGSSDVVGTDGPGDSGGGRSIVCGDTTCTGGAICCLDTPPKCIPAGESCLFGYGSTVSCDGPEDCGSGELCMDKPGAFPMQVACVAGTDPYSSYCHTQDDCGGSSSPVRCCGAAGATNALKRCIMESLCPAE